MSAARLPLRLVVLSTVLALLAAVATYVILDGGDDPAPKPDAIELTPAEQTEGRAGPASFTTFDGEQVDLASLRGRPVLVNFFASTCTPCVTEMPALEEVHQQLGDEVTFLGLAAEGDRPEEAQALVKRTGVTYRTARDKDASVMTALEAGTLLPTTILLGADGEVLARHTGKIDADGLRRLLADELHIST